MTTTVELLAEINGVQIPTSIVSVTLGQDSDACANCANHHLDFARERFQQGVRINNMSAYTV